MKNLFLSFFLLSLYLIPNENMAQKTINELFTKPKNYKEAWRVPPGRNEIRNWQIRKGYCAAEDYVMPKKVGILTVYIQDDLQYQYSTSTEIVYSRATADGVNELTQTIFQKALPDMKKYFANYGMELYEPYEYMDTPEKIQAYVDWTPGNGAVAKWLQKKLVNNKIGGYSAVAEGYRFMPLHQTFQDNKFRENLNNLMQTLNMDAYLVLSINMNGGDIIERFDASIYYKNPAQGTKTIYGAYAETIPVQLRGPFKDILLKEEKEVPNKKGKMKKQMVTVGVNPEVSVVWAALTNSACETLNTWIEGGKKKKKK